MVKGLALVDSPRQSMRTGPEAIPAERLVLLDLTDRYRGSKVSRFLHNPDVYVKLISRDAAVSTTASIRTRLSRLRVEISIFRGQAIGA